MILLAVAPTIEPALRLERDAVAAGQWYRLLSAHFVHANLLHAAVNAVATAVLFGLFQRAIGIGSFLLASPLCALAISVLLLACTPLDWYVGFSGVLHGLFAYAVLLDRRLPVWLRLALLAGLAAKVLNELFGTGPETAAWLGVAVISEAHAYGVLSGALLAAAVIWHRHHTR